MTTAAATQEPLSWLAPPDTPVLPEIDADDLHGEGIAFTVRGTLVPKGALVRSPHGGLYHRDAKRLDAWRGAIAGHAETAMAGSEVFRGPVRVDATFVLPRPQAHYLPANRSRPVRVLRPDAPIWATTKPDVDKLERALFDALTNVAIADDDQVVDGRRRKVYEDPERGLNVGAIVRVEVLA